MDNMNGLTLSMENLENVTGGTPMSIPGGKRSGRKNSETLSEILQWLEGKGNSLLEDLGLKQKRVNNSIYDSTVSMDDYT